MSTWCKSNINCAFSVSLCATSSGEKCLAKCSENYLPNLQPPPRLFTELYGEFQLVVQPPGPCDFTVLVTSLLQCHFQLQQTKTHSTQPVRHQAASALFFSTNALFTLTQLHTFTPGSRPAHPQSYLLATERLR